jgi:hypothetical protein
MLDIISAAEYRLVGLKEEHPPLSPLMLEFDTSGKVLQIIPSSTFIVIKETLWHLS